MIPHSEHIDLSSNIQKSSFLSGFLGRIRYQINGLIDRVTFRETMIRHGIAEFMKLKQKYYFAGGSFMEKAELFCQCITHADVIIDNYRKVSNMTLTSIHALSPEISPEYLHEEIMDMGLYFLEQYRIMMNDTSYKLPNRKLDFRLNIESYTRVLRALGDKRHGQLISRSLGFEFIFPEKN